MSDDFVNALLQRPAEISLKLLLLLQHCCSALSSSSIPWEAGLASWGTIVLTQVYGCQDSSKFVQGRVDLSQNASVFHLCGSLSFRKFEHLQHPITVWWRNIFIIFTTFFSRFTTYLLSSLLLFLPYSVCTTSASGNRNCMIIWETR